MNKRRVHIGIRDTNREFVFDVDPGFGEASMLDDAIKRAQEELKVNGLKLAMIPIPGHEPDAWIEPQEGEENGQESS